MTITIIITSFSFFFPPSFALYHFRHSYKVHTTDVRNNSLEAIFSHFTNIKFFSPTGNKKEEDPTLRIFIPLIQFKRECIIFIQERELPLCFLGHKMPLTFYSTIYLLGAKKHRQLTRFAFIMTYSKSDVRA